MAFYFRLLTRCFFSHKSTRNNFSVIQRYILSVCSQYQQPLKYYWWGNEEKDKQNITFAKGGPRFPIAHALRLIATTLQAHMPAVLPEMTIWGVKGGSPPNFCLLNFILFVNQGRNQNGFSISIWNLSRQRCPPPSPPVFLE